MGILMGGSTIYIWVSLPSREYIINLGILQLTFSETYLPYNNFGQCYRHFNVDYTSPTTVRANWFEPIKISRNGVKVLGM